MKRKNVLREYIYMLAGRDGIKISVTAFDKETADFRASLKARDYAPATIFMRSRIYKEVKNA